MPGIFSAWWVFGSMVLGFYSIWAAGVYIPKNSAQTLSAAHRKARLAELARLASTYTKMPGVGSPSLRECERLIFSVRVVLQELRSTHRRLLPSTRKSADVLWPHSGGARRAPVISPVDRGMLTLTNERFIYTGIRKHRDFPIEELTYVSGAKEAIALGRRGRYGVSYFTGLNAVMVSFCVTPGPDDRWKPRLVESSLTGDELVHMVRLLQHASTALPD